VTVIPKPGIETYQLEQGVQMGVYFLRVSENVAVQQNLTGLVWFRLWAPVNLLKYNNNSQFISIRIFQENSLKVADFLA
jgi:hypothetical protein